MLASPSRRLWMLALTALAAAGASYVWVDRALVRWVAHEGLRSYRALDLIAKAGEPFPYVILLGLLGEGIWRRRRDLWRPFAALASVVALGYAVKGLQFGVGRIWPETWKGGNLSYLKDGAYGFQGFHGWSLHGSFPSGHTFQAFIVAILLQRCWPALAWLGWGVAAATALGQTAMAYHFLSDVLAGALLGWGCGLLLIRLYGLRPLTAEPATA